MALPGDIIRKKEFQKLVEYKKTLFTEPDLHQLAIELTMSCNCRCLHCGSGCGEAHDPTALSDEEILKALLDLKTDLKAEGKRAPFIFVTGGEPLLRPGAIRLMQEVYRMGYNWGMTTNGILIDARTAGALEEAHISSVGVSIDGLRETHDWFRQTPGAYDRTMDALHHLLEAGVKKVMVTTVVHRKNLDELEQLYRIVRASGCHSWRVINMEPIGRALEHPELMLSGEDYRTLLDFIEKHNKKAFPVNFGCNHFLGFSREHRLRPWYFFCQSGLQVMSIRTNGDITGCLDIKDDPRMIQGNIRRDRLYDVWQNRFSVYRRVKAQGSRTCRNCKYLEECDGGGFHTWDIENGEPMLCILEQLGEL